MFDAIVARLPHSSNDPRKPFTLHCAQRPGESEAEWDARADAELADALKNHGY